MAHMDNINGCGNHPGTTCNHEIVKMLMEAFPGTVDVTDEHIDEDDYAPPTEKEAAA